MAEMEPLKIPLAVEHTTIDDVSVWSGLALRTMEEPKRLNGSPLTLRSQVTGALQRRYHMDNIEMVPYLRSQVNGIYGLF